MSKISEAKRNRLLNRLVAACVAYDAYYYMTDDEFIVVIGDE